MRRFKKKSILSFLVVFICVVGLIVIVKKYNYSGEEYIYENCIKRFDELTVNDIYMLQEQEENFYLYVGRESCEYCVIFAHELSHAVTEKEIKMYYLDSVTEYDKSGKELKEFRDLYNIEYVPYLVYFDGKNKKAEYDVLQGDYSVIKIKEFLEKNE